MPSTKCEGAKRLRMRSHLVALDLGQRGKKIFCISMRFKEIETHFLSENVCKCQLQNAREQSEQDSKPKARGSEVAE